MSHPGRDIFTPADLRAIRLLVIALGGVGILMLLVTDRETPLVVVAFITVVTIVPIAAIYVLRRLRRPKDEVPEQESDPTPSDRH
ncbi:MAG TPA: hypothetical protein VMD31_05975 [Opitutaceae bacterium]|nr:hypothetical protein [Opitutaceae bacterium]